MLKKIGKDSWETVQIARVQQALQGRLDELERQGLPSVRKVVGEVDLASAAGVLGGRKLTSHGKRNLIAVRWCTMSTGDWVPAWMGGRGKM